MGSIMLVLEFKAYGKPEQLKAVDDSIRTVQFIRNKSIQYWLDNRGCSGFDLNKYATKLAQEYPFVKELNSQARQASSERAWLSISRFYKNCRDKVPGKKGFPRFQKDCRSVEYKTTGYKLSDDCKSITFTDKKGIGKLKLKGTRDLYFYNPNNITRVRIIKRADGYYVQFVFKISRLELVEKTNKKIGLDVGLKEYYTDSNNETVENPKFLRKSESRLKFFQRRLSRKIKGSSNRLKAKKVFSNRHLKVSRQRKDHAIKLARCVIKSNDLVVYEDLSIKNMVKNHCLAKSINDASWYQFRCWLEYYAQVFDKVVLAVNPQYTSQICSNCSAVVKKSLSTRTHNCKCGCVLDRDHNAAKNILNRGLETLNRVGHTQIYA